MNQRRKLVEKNGKTLLNLQEVEEKWFGSLKDGTLEVGEIRR